MQHTITSGPNADGTLQYAGLRWTGLQGFATRELARGQAATTAAYADPTRPGMQWVVKNVRRVGPGQWRADHYVVVASLSCENGGWAAWQCATDGCTVNGHAASLAARTARAALPVAMPGEHIAAGVARAAELRRASQDDAARFETLAATPPAPLDRPNRRVHCAWSSCSKIHESTPQHRATYGGYCGGQDCPGSRIARTRAVLDGPLDNGRPYSDAPVPQDDDAAPVVELTARDRHELGLMSRAMGTPVSELLTVATGRATPARHDDQDTGEYPQRIAHLCRSCGRGHFHDDDAAPVAGPCDRCPFCDRARALPAAQDVATATGGRLAARIGTWDVRADGSVRATPDADDVAALSAELTAGQLEVCHRAGHHLTYADLTCGSCQADARSLARAFSHDRLALAAILPAPGSLTIPGRVSAHSERS